ncbi:hypothetical protein AnigIFM60653_002133 [Aspergillus niger]|nr:hypothetical protein AnigIFM50267_009808 [Aspergillus niger]GLA02608.1 hypothetical protein AnigIFM60653_002133 [Aspergillus niger]GLA34235.1 hypothetical protein AnigIFM63309_005655 [Aspergillus niger]
MAGDPQLAVGLSVAVDTGSRGKRNRPALKAGVTSHGPKQEDDLRVHGMAIEAQFMTLIRRRGPTRPVLEISKGLCTAVWGMIGMVLGN